MSNRSSRRLSSWERVVLVATTAPLLMILLIGPAVSSGTLDLPENSYCVSVRWWGASCPGCGLTRSIVLLSNGQVAESFQMNPMGIGFTVWLLLLFLARPAKIQFRSVRSLVRWDVGMTVLLLAAALIRVVLFYATA